jgi:hypothetical protein
MMVVFTELTIGMLSELTMESFSLLSEDVMILLAVAFISTDPLPFTTFYEEDIPPPKETFPPSLRVFLLFVLTGSV